MFIVSADVFPMSKNTARLRANAARALEMNTDGEMAGGAAKRLRNSTETAKKTMLENTN